MTRKELIEKVNGMEIDEDTKISLMEDITDLEDINAMEDDERAELLAKIEGLEMKAEELKEKYKARFLGDIEPIAEDEVEELTEEEVIDIKEI